MDKDKDPLTVDKLKEQWRKNMKEACQKESLQSIKEEHLEL